MASLGASLAAALLVAAGCDSTPAATPPADAAAKTAAPSGTSATSTTGPKRLEAKRPAAPAPALAAASTAPAAGTTAAKQPDATSGLMNPGDEVEGVSGNDSARAAARTKGASRAAAAPPADVSAAPGARVPSAAERAAAARMAADNDAKRRAEAAATAERTAKQNDVDAEHASWGVLLATVTGAESRANAMSIREQVIRRYPALKDAYVRSIPHGSVVLVGRFDGVQDPAAQAQLKLVKETMDGNVRAFPRAMLTRLGANAAQGPPGPNDLRIVRQSRPTQTLYTLQVAVWSAFGTDEVKMSDIKRSAENYCRQLRSEGNEAYYFHDFDTKTSTVTIGVFGTDAYDSKSTLYAPEVDAVMRKFPKHLVNGEELLVPLDPAKPQGKTMPQAPRLVEIPQF
jgi:hypothetical protein